MRNKKLYDELIKALETAKNLIEENPKPDEETKDRISAIISNCDLKIKKLSEIGII